MADKERLIDANALKEDFLNDWTNYMMESLRGNYHDTIRISNVIERIEDAPTIEAEPVKHDTELSSILQDYGIKDTDTLRYILDQYQKIIVDITGGQMSYLTYPAQAVIDCTNDYYLSALADLKESSNNEAEPDNGWMSVDDRLPDADYDCLVWYSCDTAFGKSKSWGISHCSRGDWYTKHLNGDNIVVLYWLPLPEPPKGE